MTVTKTDLIIVGGGPAGLSACLTFARLGRPAVLYDSGIYRNAFSKESHTIPAAEAEDPAVWRRRAYDQIARGYSEWITLKQGRITDLKRDGAAFEGTDESGNVIKARKVILATGIKDNLPNIKGLQEIWGGRAIHCVFCHGTETRHSPLAFLLTPGASKMNPMVVDASLKLWSSLKHPSIQYLTHGIDITTPNGLAASGLGPHLDVIKRRGHGIITDKIAEIESTPNGLLVHFEGDRTMLPLGYIAVLPESWSAHPDAKDFLGKELLGAELAPTGTIAPPDLEDIKTGMPPPPRMGDDPRTKVHGLFWAGNSGSFMANVNVSVAQGQMAAATAGSQLGEEDLEAAKSAL